MQKLAALGGLFDAPHVERKALEQAAFRAMQGAFSDRQPEARLK